jgi:rubrerythrin
MNIAKAPGELLEAMREHEQALAHLYELYAEKYPDYEDFWTELSLEENLHAAWLDKLWSEIENGSEDIVVERFPIGAVQRSTEYVKKLEDTASQPDFTLINALSTALRLEEALMENKFFEVCEGDSVKTKRTLNSLAQGTMEHCQKVRKLLQQLR